MSFKVFFFLFSALEPILAILVKGYPRNTSVNLFGNRAIGLGGGIVQMFFIF